MEILSDIQRLARSAELDVGVAINYIEYNDEINLNADNLYHLASVVKVPIMVEVFRQIKIDETLTLDERLQLPDGLKLSGTGVLKYLREGLNPTIEDLLTLMIIISDNTATDMLLGRIGGPLTVDRTMKHLGLSDIHTKMSIRQAHLDRGVTREPLIDPREAEMARKDLHLKFDSACYTASPKGNSASPRAMNQLLSKIFKGELWSKEACHNMMEIMYKQQLNSRIPVKLPRGTPVAHKDGTIAGVANDSGIIEISKKNHCAITIFTRDEEFMRNKNIQKASEKLPLVESTIGDIALLAYNKGKELET